MVLLLHKFTQMIKETYHFRLQSYATQMTPLIVFNGDVYFFKKIYQVKKIN